MMQGFLEAFRNGRESARATPRRAWSEDAPADRDDDAKAPPEPGDDDEDHQHLIAEMAAYQEEQAARIAGLEAALQERADQIESLRAALAAKPAPPAAADARKLLDQFWRRISKHIHPDAGAADETGEQACERIFKAIRAEIDAAKKGAS